MQAIAVNIARTYPLVIELGLEGDRAAQLERLKQVTLGDWARVSTKDAQSVQLILGSYLGTIVSAYAVSEYTRGDDDRIRWSGRPADDFAGLIGTPLPGGDWRRGQARPLRWVHVARQPGNAEAAMQGFLIEMLRYRHDSRRRELVEELESRISVRVQSPDAVVIRVPAGVSILIEPV
ncbi:hypothetical protein GA707_18925 [Nostocoides sp. F2B08]|uniref:hypothetical protein n=1 Tax=Nostocoides sp. F2B08 TaxID=2653936 RepID=UPI001262F4F0|nr:hypothetical protein [Tetrasphaera sp. F2B08]KAB7740965.1 hypothetical protein GA707_18925 [Tetrasphaera sp. F2B08]